MSTDAIWRTKMVEGQIVDKKTIWRPADETDDYSETIPHLLQSKFVCLFLAFDYIWIFSIYTN